jgi:hypothetical protein
MTLLTQNAFDSKVGRKKIITELYLLHRKVHDLELIAQQLSDDEAAPERERGARCLLNKSVT